MIYRDNSYAESQYINFPSTSIDPKLKEEPEYCLSWARSIYSTHLQNKSGIPYDELYNWEKQRLYGKGQQAKDQYKSIALTEDKTSNDTYTGVDNVTRSTLEERRKGWKNVNDDIVSVAPKIKDVFHGLFDSQDFEVNADAIDLNSGAEKDRAKWGLMAQTLFQKELAKLRALGNIPEEQKSFVPSDVTELEMYENAGGFKLNIAKDMEKLIKHTFDISDWNHIIKRKLIDDVLDIGYIAAEEVYDPDTRKSRAKYLDPSRLAVQYSSEEDYENPDWGGYYTLYTISELEQWGFTREELARIAFDQSDKFDNPSQQSWPEYNKKNTLGGYDYDRYKVPVYKVFWIDSNTSKYLKWTTRNGKERMKEVGYDVDDSKFTKKEVLHHSKRIVYKCNWIIGTEKVFDYGIAHDQLRPTPNKPIIPFRVVKITDTPIMKRLIPILDKMQLAWLRYQNALIMSAGGGWAINVRLLKNITLGGDKLNVRDILGMMRNQKMLFYSDTPAHGRYEGGETKPVTPLPSMLQDEIASAIQEFEYSMKQVEHLTGLTPVALGGTPEERAGKATTELSFAATQNVMKPIVNNIMTLKQKIAESAMLHIQVLIRNNKESYEAYRDVIGRLGVDRLKMAEEDGRRYGITLRARPTDQDWAEIYALIQEAMALGRDGVKSIDIDDALYLYEMRDNGTNMSEMRLTLSYKIKKYKEEQQQRALQTQDFQAKQDQQLTAQKAQQESKGKQQDAQIQSGLSKQEHGQTMQLENFKANMEFKQKVMEMANQERLKEMELEQKRKETA